MMTVLKELNAGDPDLLDPSVKYDRLVLVHTEQKGEFWKPCPGTTKGYFCCGYQIITPFTGCGMYCRYCILQAYFDRQCQVMYDNFDDLEREIHLKMSSWAGVVRFGTGEFGDSLFADGTTNLACSVAALLDQYPNALVEFKTKSTQIHNLDKIKNPRKVVIGFSMNTPRMIELQERGTAPLEARLEAAAQCVKMGFSVAFHFDPMIWYPQWQNDYPQVVQAIARYIKDPQSIAWISMGGFRTMPQLKNQVRGDRGYESLFGGEMIYGEDGKLRYFRPLRAQFYRTMNEAFSKVYDSVTLYLCMESPELWRESGMIGRIPRGLVQYLDNRAQTILGI